jgi:3D (Asp-Asp-Asp) domain-containing protein
VIPLGTRLQIEGMGDTVFRALDTGGGIRGRWVDVWFHTDWDAIQHGVRHLNVQVVPES